MQGALMVHDGYHVPSLVSGNASEWNRVLQRLIDHASSTKTTVHLKRSHKTVVTRTPSDMQTLVELRVAKPTLLQAEATVAGVEALTSPTSPRVWNGHHPLRGRFILPMHTWVRGISSYIQIKVWKIDRTLRRRGWENGKRRACNKIGSHQYPPSTPQRRHPYPALRQLNL